MNMIRCANDLHYYDSSTYEVCPYCTSTSKYSIPSYIIKGQNYRTTSKMAASIKLRIGNIFDVSSDLLVLPCNTYGNVSDFVQQYLQKYSISAPPPNMPLGYLYIQPFAGAGAITKYIGFAVSVDRMICTPEAINYIGQQIGQFTTQDPLVRVISSPLLGIGAGGLSSEVAAIQLREGFLARAQSEATLVVSVLHTEIFEQTFISLRNGADEVPKNTSLKEADNSQVAISGGVHVDSQGDANIHGDVVGRDKVINNATNITNNYYQLDSKAKKKRQSTSRVYLMSVVQKYRDLETVYTDLPISVAPQIPMEFFSTFLDTSSFQVLLERSVGKEYHNIERKRVPRIEDVMNEYPQIVLLGDPGCGKSVALWRLALNYAKNAINQPDSLWPVVIELGEYDGSKSLQTWIMSRGEAAPGFKERLRRGRLILLFDGLNELPRHQYSASIAGLRDFISTYHECRYAVTCRRLDYDESLGLQQVEIEPLNVDNIKAFVSNYLRDQKHSQHLVALLSADPKLLSLASNALNLKLIVSLYALVYDKFPRNRSRLMDGFIGALYRRETYRLKETLLTEAQLRVPLAKLAFSIQAEVGKGTFVGQEWAISHLGLKEYSIACAVLETAKEMGLLEIKESTLRFHHQLIQEYFVACSLEEHLKDKRSKRRFWIPAVTPKNMIHSDKLEPLLSSPTTGWEEATIMLAGSKVDASDLVNEIADVNPILAGRCIAEGQSFVKSEVSDRVVRGLLLLIEDPKVQLNVRAHAGMLLGEFEDPRFEKLSLPNGYALLPQLVPIPTGVYLLGSDKRKVTSSYHDEVPRHAVNVQQFLVGKYPVTNSEFACFVEDNGYDKREFWTDEGWAWKEGCIGENLKQWLLDGYRNVRSQVRAEVERLEPSHSEDSTEMDTWWRILMEWPDNIAEIELAKLLEERSCCRHNAPCYWDDPVFNGKELPVVATWFEAQAYCQWLSYITKKQYRLPTECEWEAATGGANQRYPWGNTSNIRKCNILPSRVFRTTPVGIYGNGVSRFGIHDLIGNVWEWTSSAKFPYPYNAADGREKPYLPDCRRIVRGGSWAVSQSNARSSCRGNFPPDNMVRNYIGFRVVLCATK